jgi:hypothetical protein
MHFQFYFADMEKGSSPPAVDYNKGSYYLARCGMDRSTYRRSEKVAGAVMISAAEYPSVPLDVESECTDCAHEGESA